MFRADGANPIHPTAIRLREWERRNCACLLDRWPTPAGLEPGPFETDLPATSIVDWWVRRIRIVDRPIPPIW